VQVDDVRSSAAQLTCGAKREVGHGEDSVPALGVADPDAVHLYSWERVAAAAVPDVHDVPAVRLPLRQLRDVDFLPTGEGRQSFGEASDA
jgi:hypothetical protein